MGKEPKALAVLPNNSQA